MTSASFCVSAEEEIDLKQRQLEYLYQEYERLRIQLESSKSIISVSTACQDLIDYTKTLPDPLSPNWHGTNVWTEPPRKRGKKKKKKHHGCCGGSKTKK